MRRLLKWLIITLGIAAVIRKLRSRRSTAELSTVLSTGATTTEDPANELRRKLDETREPEAPAATAEEPSPESSVEDRRADVHDQGRSTIDEMRSSTEDE